MGNWAQISKFGCATSPLQEICRTRPSPISIVFSDKHNKKTNLAHIITFNLAKLGPDTNFPSELPRAEYHYFQEGYRPKENLLRIIYLRITVSVSRSIIFRLVYLKVIVSISQRRVTRIIFRHRKMFVGIHFQMLPLPFPVNTFWIN